MSVSVSNDEKGAAVAPGATTIIQYEEDGFETDSLEKKWQGTAADKLDMDTLGRVQELRRNFNFVSIVGLGSTLLCTWVFVVSTLGIALVNGGTAGLFWGYIAAVIGLTLVYASLAEMASMAPTSGGQYHWVSEFAPRSCQKYLSYITGWTCFTGWQGAILSTAFLAGTIIQGLFALNMPDYVFQRWHGTLLVIGIIAFSMLFNTFLAKKLPLIENMILVIYVVGFFATIIPLWVLAPRNSAKSVFLEFSNGGNWSSTGTSVMIGLLTPITSMLGFDCMVHMSEEVKDAGTTLPKAIMWSVYMSSLLGLVTVLTMCFTLGDLSSVIASPTGYPFIQIYYNVIQNYSGTNFMVAIPIILLTCACIAEIATASRQLWSFARDKGPPFSTTFARINRTYNTPLNAILLSLLVTVLLSLINIGSAVALNAILSLTTVSMLNSYLVSIACVLLKRLRHEPLPLRRWSLGRYGALINTAAIAFILPVYVFMFFPAVTPVRATTMNWGIVIYGGMIVLATAYYVVGGGRGKYVPPVVLVRRDI